MLHLTQQIGRKFQGIQKQDKNFEPAAVIYECIAGRMPIPLLYGYRDLVPFSAAFTGKTNQ